MTKQRDVVEYMRESNESQKKKEKNWTLQYVHTKEEWKEYEREENGGIGHWIV